MHKLLLLLIVALTANSAHAGGFSLPAPSLAPEIGEHRRVSGDTEGAAAFRPLNHHHPEKGL